ncbi:MAG: insulinase family protein, partial [Acidobacteriota bacterium]|nr:insulinase family protein [Acidobacteriota bacterium]
IPSQPQPKHPDLSEPVKAEAKTELYKDPLAQVPGVVLGYPGPKRRSPDYYALCMTDVLLTGGESSRLQLDLVKGKQSVVQYEGDLGWPFAGASDYRDPLDYALFLLYKPNFKAADIVSQVQDEITRIQKDGVDQKELDRARTFFRAQRISSLQSALNRAQLLGKYEILDGDPSVINTEMDKFLAVTPAQIQAAARKYLVASQRDVLEIQPAPPASAPPAQESK